MESIDTVTLSLKNYNYLRDFNKAIHENKVLRITSGKGFPFLSEEFLTESEAVKKIAKEYEILQEENKLLRENKSDAYSFLKEMNYWQFRKWKKGNKE